MRNNIIAQVTDVQQGFRSFSPPHRSHLRVLCLVQGSSNPITLPGVFTQGVLPFMNFACQGQLEVCDPGLRGILKQAAVSKLPLLPHILPRLWTRHSSGWSHPPQHFDSATARNGRERAVNSTTPPRNKHGKQRILLQNCDKRCPFGHPPSNQPTCD